MCLSTSRLLPYDGTLPQSSPSRPSYLRWLLCPRESTNIDARNLRTPSRHSRRRRSPLGCRIVSGEAVFSHISHTRRLNSIEYSKQAPLHSLLSRFNLCSRLGRLGPSDLALFTRSSSNLSGDQSVTLTTGCTSYTVTSTNYTNNMRIRAKSYYFLNTQQIVSFQPIIFA